jgi:biotin synthase
MLRLTLIVPRWAAWPFLIARWGIALYDPGRGKDGWPMAGERPGGTRRTAMRYEEHQTRPRSEERVTDQEFETALRRGTRGYLDFESAWSLCDGARRPDRVRELFSAASLIRDRKLGRRLALSAHIHMIADCGLSPSCLYCSLASSDRAVSGERARLTTKELTQGVRFAVDRGVKSIVLVGGTDLNGLDSPVRRTVERVREITDIDLAVDVGPSLSLETVRWLKDEKVGTVYCSIETANEQAFADAKPGDSLEARVKCMEMLEREGVKLGSVVMNGLGSTADLLRSILYLRRFKNLSILDISTFHPVRGTPWGERRPASVRTSLKALSIARLVFPSAQVGLAEVEVEDPGSASRTLSRLSAGGGNTLAGVLVYKGRKIDSVKLIKERASLLGFEIGG